MHSSLATATQIGTQYALCGVSTNVCVGLAVVTEMLILNPYL